MRQLVTIILTAALLSGCTLNAPKYTPTVASIQSIKASGAAPLKVSKVGVASQNVNKISLRGSSLNSPYGDYNGYLEQALKDELTAAGILDENSTTIIGAVLTQNRMNAAMSTGDGGIAAIFTVSKAGSEVFNKEVSASVTWESSFVGAIAIPNAINSYPELVSALITNLFNDTDFLSAIK